MKDAADHLDRYFDNLAALRFDKRRISLGVLESDSRDDTFKLVKARLKELGRRYRRARAWKRDFGYRIPDGVPRWTEQVQFMRRVVLAKSRNHLLFRALDDEEWVLWLDVDVVEYADDIIQTLINTGRSIVHPNCVLDYGGPSFDRNAWRGPGPAFLSDLRAEGDLVEIDTVGGTMLLIKADIHRDGLIFLAFPYGRGNPRVRPGVPELETEGLGFMARDMGHRCWGMPNLEIRHARK